MELITRTVAVNRTRTNEEAMAATGRKQFLIADVISTMPRCEDDFSATFVSLNRKVHVAKLDNELAKLGWELVVDPVGLAAINEADPAFADTYPNGTQWKDAEGNYCYVVFNGRGDERAVGVNRARGYWSCRKWFACRRKS